MNYFLHPLYQIINWRIWELSPILLWKFNTNPQYLLTHPKKHSHNSFWSGRVNLNQYPKIFNISTNQFTNHSKNHYLFWKFTNIPRYFSIDPKDHNLFNAKYLCQSLLRLAENFPKHYSRNHWHYRRGSSPRNWGEAAWKKNAIDEDSPQAPWCSKSAEGVMCHRKRAVSITQKRRRNENSYSR